MCDCYSARCRRCQTRLPVHLADFDTPRKEVAVYCAKHLPKYNVRVFTLTEVDEDYPVGWKMGIRYLTPRARAHADGNHPNLSAMWDTEDKK